MKKIGLVFSLVLFFSSSVQINVFGENYSFTKQKPFDFFEPQHNQYYCNFNIPLDSIEKEKFSVITPLDKHREKRQVEFSLLQKQAYNSNSNSDLSDRESITNKDAVGYVGEAWVKNYSLGIELGDDYATSIATDDSGNVYITGSSKDSITSYDYITIKYNSYGEEQWMRRYNGVGNSVDVAYSIKVDNLGNAYVTGKSYSSTTKLDFATVKYNSFGVEQWVSLYNGAGDSNDVAYDLALDRFGNVYVTGVSYGLGTGYDYATVKYDFNGLEEWSVRYHGNSTYSSNDYAYSLAVDSVANIYVTGYSWGSNGNYDYATIKYSSTGVEQWVKRYNGYRNYNDYACAIAVDNSGNVYVTGTSQGLVTVDDYITIKYNTDGVMQWSVLNDSPGTSSDNATDIAIDTSQNAVVTGWCFYPSQSSDCVTLKYNTNGIKLWESRYNATGNSRNYSNSLILDSSGNSYITGTCEFAISGYDYITVKYNSSGYQQWNTHFASSGNSFDEANSIAVDRFGNVFITGHTTNNGSKIITTIKYTQTPTSIGEILSDLPATFLLSQNYPNPFNPSTSIQYAISSTQFVTLKVYDLLGREVATLVNEEKQAGTYNAQFTMNNLPAGRQGVQLSSGIYFYKLQAGDFVETKKMILLK